MAKSHWIEITENTSGRFSGVFVVTYHGHRNHRGEELVSYCVSRRSVNAAISRFARQLGQPARIIDRTGGWSGPPRGDSNQARGKRQ